MSYTDIAIFYVLYILRNVIRYGRRCKGNVGHGEGSCALGGSGRLSPADLGNPTVIERPILRRSPFPSSKASVCGIDVERLGIEFRPIPLHHILMVFVVRIRQSF